VLFGTGIRYFGELVGRHVMLEDPVVVQGTGRSTSVTRCTADWRL
jgi:hypothetical protein